MTIRKSMTYGTLPSCEEFDAAFDNLVGDDEGFRFENDKRVGTCGLTCSKLWDELVKAHSEFEREPGLSLGEDAGQWCSDVLSILGFEWI